MKRMLLTVVILVVLVYVAGLAAVFALHRSFIYYPDASRAAPAVAGLAIQEVEITTADGEWLVGWYLPPEDERPVILFFHGNADHLALQEGRWRRIATVGAGFLGVGYRGYSGSTGRPTERGLHEDAKAAYAWLRERHGPDDIIIHGHSLGSGVAVRLAAENPARALILESPFTAIVDVASEAYPWFPVGLVMRDRYLSRQWIGKVKAPVLIVHGDKDTVIPFRHGEKLYDLAKPPKTFVRMIGSDHNTLTRDGAYDHIWRFLGLASPPTAAPGFEAAAKVRSAPGQ